MADLGCSPNAAVAFDYLVGKGLKDFQAAAVVGNLQVESPGVNPQLAVMDTNNKLSRGIAMWQPDRWNALLASTAGRDPLALDTQLDFLWNELPSHGLQQLLATTTIEDAVLVFQNQFERPLASSAHTDRRIAYAQAALYACPAVRPPAPSSKIGVAAIAAGVLSLVAAAGYGIYKNMPRLRSRLRPRPEPTPYSFPRPSRQIPVSFRRTT